MPKKVDHEARRQEIAQALWRIASTRGLDGVSLRDVAAEADISLGRLQHYFRTKDEMLLFALRHINSLAEQRISERIGAVAASLQREPSPRTMVRECLMGMLPLDDRSRVGTLVGAAYFARAIHDERMRGEAQEGIPKLAEFLADVLRRARDRGELAQGRDIEPYDEAMLLISLVDGLTAYTLLGVHTEESVRRLLDAHLGAVFAGGGEK
ncbi:TetR/AcrR family transcriptional regulator [Streptomyces sp. NPDC058657]|uniref:TetR/AcrR family transcriptional regulator n=1 Tax=unclassified Streptomyces TaxID=2593676 RepID=UPI003650A893